MKHSRIVFQSLRFIFVCRSAFICKFILFIDIDISVCILMSGFVAWTRPAVSRAPQVGLLTWIHVPQTDK